jgi:hypothetical protein
MEVYDLIIKIYYPPLLGSFLNSLQTFTKKKKDCCWVVVFAVTHTVQGSEAYLASGLFTQQESNSPGNGFFFLGTLILLYDIKKTHH